MPFYALYWVYSRYRLSRFLNPESGFMLAALVSVSYWWMTDLLGDPMPGYLIWIAPFGWLYLFFLAILIVRAYRGDDGVLPLHRLSHPVCLVAIIALIVGVTLARVPLGYSSKETWVVPLFIVFALTTMRYLRGVPAPPLVKRINEYSFGIYLAHPLFFGLIDALDNRVSLNTAEYTLLLVTAGLFGSIALNIAANRTEWGGLMLGKRLRAP